jgi:hypothetical protein
VKPTLSKPELVSAVREHFASIPAPDEDETIGQFLRALRRAGDTDSEAAAADDKDFSGASAIIAPTKQRRRKPQSAGRESPKKALIPDYEVNSQANSILPNSLDTGKRRKALQTPSTAKIH